jgi:hypothetical protein
LEILKSNIIWLCSYEFPGIKQFDAADNVEKTQEWNKPTKKDQSFAFSSSPNKIYKK